MADKPADFLVSVINFFGVVLPGALLAYVILFAFKEGGGEAQFTLPYLDGVSQKWAAFVVVSYLLGHFVSLAGALFDSVCDRFYVLRNLLKDDDLTEDARSVADGLLNRFKSGKLPLVSAGALPEQSYRKKSITAKLMNTFLSKHFLQFVLNHGDDSLKATKRISRWANTFLRLTSPEAALQLDQMEGDSKLFRSLAVVLTGCLVINIFHLLRLGRGPAALCFALLCLSLWRYANLRWKRTRLSYEFLIAVDSLAKLEVAPGKTNLLNPPKTVRTEENGEFDRDETAENCP